MVCGMQEEVWLMREGLWEGRVGVVGLYRAWRVDFPIVFVLRNEVVCVCVFELEGGLCVGRLSGFEDDLGALMGDRLFSALATLRDCGA